MNEVTWKKSYHDNGQLKYKTPYLNGKIHGVIKGYYNRGSLLFEIPYVNDKIHGVEKGYHSNGNLSYERHCIHDIEVTKEEWETHELITQLAEL